jgi:hypothetical protein
VASQLKSLASGLPGAGGAAPSGTTTGGNGATGGTGSFVPGASGAQRPARGGTAAQPTATLETAPAATPRVPSDSLVTPQGAGTSQDLPDRTSCDEIRGTPYRSAAERDFFLANCVSGR